VVDDVGSATEDAEERMAAISFSARWWLVRAVALRASRGTRTS
jgi:hypothetical protein